MPKASWKNCVIADASPDVVKVVEGNVYFPIETVRKEFLRASNTQTRCGWKGTAGYYDIVVDGEVNKDAAWYYAEPFEAAKSIAGYVAFWRGVVVTDAPPGKGSMPPAAGDASCIVTARAADTNLDAFTADKRPVDM